MNTTAPEQRDVIELAGQVKAFVDEQVIPLEHTAFDADGVKADVRAQLQAKAASAGLFGIHLPEALGGQGLDMRRRATVYIEAGRSVLGPHAINCSAPDDGNIILLDAVADAGQRERYLQPLAAGTISSCFSMTEPAPGAGSDPSMLRTTATRTGDRWRIDGVKWFSTGAIGARFAICMARTGDAIDKDRGATMFLIDLDNPGVRVARSIESLDRSAVGSHCEVHFDGCEVSGDAVLGEVDLGYRYAQVRLGPARLTHCMRWLGLAWRAHELAIAHAREREAFGSRLGDLGLVQGLIADSELDLRTSRLLTLEACAVLDAGGTAQLESSIAKVHVSEAVFRVVDRAIQIHGALGVSGDSILSSFYTDIRPFRIYDGPSEVHRWSIARRVLRSGSTSLGVAGWGL